MSWRLGGLPGLHNQTLSQKTLQGSSPHRQFKQIFMCQTIIITEETSWAMQGNTQEAEREKLAALAVL